MIDRFELKDAEVDDSFFCTLDTTYRKERYETLQGFKVSVCFDESKELIEESGDLTDLQSHQPTQDRDTSLQIDKCQTTSSFEFDSS